MCLGKLNSAHVIARYYWDFVWVLCLYVFLVHKALQQVAEACISCRILP